MPSVSRAFGSACSTSEMVAIRVGEMAKPARKSIGTRTPNEWASITGAVQDGVGTPAPTRMRVVVDDRQVMAPEISPDSMLPNAHSASTGTDHALWPSSSERATVAASALPEQHSGQGTRPR